MTQFEEEDRVPEYLNFFRPWEQNPLRQIDDFCFFTLPPSADAPFHLVHLDKISEASVTGSGLLRPDNTGRGPAIPVQLGQVLEWSLEFGPTPGDCGIWVITESEIWYRLLKPHKDYEHLFKDLFHSFEITTNVFFVVSENLDSEYETIVPKLAFSEEALVQEAPFVLRHLAGDSRLRRSNFTHGLREKSTAFLGEHPERRKKGLKRIRNEDDAKEQKERHKKKKQPKKEGKRKEDKPGGELPREGGGGAPITDHEADSKQQGQIVQSLASTALPRLDAWSKEAKDRLPHIPQDQDEGLLYRGLSFSAYKSIPKMFLNEHLRLQCFVCQKTFSRPEFIDFVDHLHRHRMAMLGAFTEEERKAMMKAVCFDQMRVRSRVERDLLLTDSEALTPKPPSEPLPPWPAAASSLYPRQDNLDSTSARSKERGDAMDVDGPIPIGFSPGLSSLFDEAPPFTDFLLH